MTGTGPVNTRQIGRFAVTASRANGQAFRAALVFGLEVPEQDDDHLPITYPLRWLNEGAVRDAILAALAPVDGQNSKLPVHVEQRLDIPDPLAPDTPYWLELSLTGPDDRHKVQVLADLCDETGTPLGQMTSTLLLINTGAGAAP